jgi:hypothetical protein
MSAFSLSQRDQKENRSLGHSEHISATHKVSSISYAKLLLHFLKIKTKHIFASSGEVLTT